MEGVRNFRMMKAHFQQEMTIKCMKRIIGVPLNREEEDLAMSLALANEDVI